MKAENRSGHALVEFSVASMMLLMLVFGLIDFARAIYTRQILAALSREAANLASRGTTLSNTVAAVRTSALPLDMDAKGYVIVSVIHRNANNSVVVTNQLTGGGSPAASRVAAGGLGSVPVLPVTNPVLPVTNQTLYVAEVYYGYAPVTPIGRLLRASLPSKLYDVAYF
jgi:Flp pilus assembly protein TadG